MESDLFEANALGFRLRKPASWAFVPGAWSPLARWKNAAGDDETGYLAPLREIVASGKTPAEVLLDRYNGAWGGDIGRIYDEMAF